MSSFPPRMQEIKMQITFMAFDKFAAVFTEMRPEGRGLHGLLILSSSIDNDWLSMSIKNKWDRTQMGTKNTLVDVMSKFDTMKANPD